MPMGFLQTVSCLPTGDCCTLIWIQLNINPFVYRELVRSCLEQISYHHTAMHSVLMCCVCCILAIWSRH